MKKNRKFLSLLLSSLLLIGCLSGCAGDEPPEEPAATTAAAPATTAATTTADTTTVTTTEKPREEPAPDGDEVTDELTQNNLFQKITQRMNELKSYTSQVEMDLNISMMGMSMAVNMEVFSAADAEQDRYYTEMNSTVMGEKSTAVTYFDRELYFMDTNGDKRMAEITPEVLELLKSDTEGILELDATYFESFKLYSSDDGYLLIVSGLKEGSGLLDSLPNSEDMEAFKIDLSEVKIEMTITKDLCISEMTMSLELSMDLSSLPEAEGSDLPLGEVTASMEVTATYGDFDAATEKVIKPDTSDAVLFDIEDLLSDLFGEEPETLPSTDESVADEL